MRPVELRSTMIENRKRRYTIYGAILVGFTAGLFVASALYELMPSACAAEATMPMKVEIVQCGSREELPEACSRDERCCALIEPAAGEEDRSGDGPQINYEVHDWPWTEAPADSYHAVTIYE